VATAIAVDTVAVVTLFGHGIGKYIPTAGGAHISVGVGADIVSRPNKWGE
jgi:hypothetical protein